MNYTISICKFNSSNQIQLENSEIDNFKLSEIPIRIESLKKLIESSDVMVHPAWSIMTHYKEIIFFQVRQDINFIITSRGLQYTIKQFSIQKYELTRLIRDCKINQILMNES